MCIAHATRPRHMSSAFCSHSSEQKLHTLHSSHLRYDNLWQYWQCSRLGMPVLSGGPSTICHKN